MIFKWKQMAKKNDSFVMDDYLHSDKSVVYILENIPGPTTNSDEYKTLLENFNSQIIGNCKCKDSCIELSCACVARSGNANYIIQNDHIKICRAKLEGNVTYPIFECNSFCECNNNCNNRVVQKGPKGSLIIKKCEGTKNTSKGLGLFSLKIIQKGEFICEYAGEVIIKSQALQRQKFNIEMAKMNYIFCLNEHSDNHITQTIIDPSQFGNIGRYINHCCEPNCKIIPVRVDSPIPKLAIFACTDIMPNSEITFDYGPHSLGFGIPNNELRRTRCLCGARKCREWMPFDSY